MPYTSYISLHDYAAIFTCMHGSQQRWTTRLYTAAVAYIYRPAGD